MNELTEIVTYYFMAQRVGPADPKDAAAHAKYVNQVTLLHQMVVAGMKAKQTTDLKQVEELRSLAARFKGPEEPSSKHRPGFRSQEPCSRLQAWNNHDPPRNQIRNSGDKLLSGLDLGTLGL